MSDFLNVKELSKALRVPIGTINLWVSSNKIPFIRFGKHIRFDYEEVINHFKSRPTK